MTTALQAFTPQELMAAAQNLEADAAQASSGTKQYLKFTKAGEWLFGQEESVIEEDDKLALNPMSLTTGYVCWKEGKGIDERLGFVMRGEQIPKPASDELGPFGPDEGWSDQKGVDLVLEGDDRVELQYRTSSRGGMNALASIQKAISAKIKTEGKLMVPIINLKSDSYKHKKYGKIFFPVIEIVDWKEMTDSEF